MEGGCCPCNCAVGPRASSAPEWQPPTAAPWLIFAWVSYLYTLPTPAPLTLGGRDRPGPSKPVWRSWRLCTVTQLSWPMISGRSRSKESLQNLERHQNVIVCSLARYQHFPDNFIKLRVSQAANIQTANSQTGKRTLAVTRLPSSSASTCKMETLVLHRLMTLFTKGSRWTNAEVWVLNCSHGKVDICHLLVDMRLRRWELTGWAVCRGAVWCFHSLWLFVGFCWWSPVVYVEPVKIIFRSLVKTEHLKVQHRQSNSVIFHYSIEHALYCYIVSI